MDLLESSESNNNSSLNGESIFAEAIQDSFKSFRFAYLFESLDSFK